MSFSLEHLDDRPRPAAASPRSSIADDDVNWYPLVRAAFLAALTAFLVKLVSLGFFAARAGIQLEIQFWRGWIPHLSMQTPPDEFAQIVTRSTLVMAVVATVLFTVQVLRTNADRMVVWGWSMGVFVAFETLLLELLRHALEPPVVDTTTVWRTAIPLTAGAAIAVVYSLITRERVERPAAAVPLAVVATADGSRAVDTRPGAHRGEVPPPAVAVPVGASVFGDGAPEPSFEPSPEPVPAAWPPPRPVAEPVPALVGAAAPPPPPAAASATVAAALAAASVPNRVVDTRPQAAAAPDPLDLPAPRRAVAPRPAADVGPAPIVDTRPAAQRDPDAVVGAEPRAGGGTAPA